MKIDATKVKDGPVREQLVWLETYGTWLTTHVVLKQQLKQEVGDKMRTEVGAGSTSSPSSAWVQFAFSRSRVPDLN